VPLTISQVASQEGSFYGGWITPEITGGDRGFKGGMLQLVRDFLYLLFPNKCCRPGNVGLVIVRMVAKSSELTKYQLDKSLRKRAIQSTSYFGSET
jgi:hypothetical protein